MGSISPPLLSLTFCILPLFYVIGPSQFRNISCERFVTFQFYNGLTRNEAGDVLTGLVFSFTSQRYDPTSNRFQ